MHQHEKLQRLRTLARLLDDQFRIPGTNRRVGLDGLLAYVPRMKQAAERLSAVWDLE